MTAVCSHWPTRELKERAHGANSPAAMVPANGRGIASFVLGLVVWLLTFGGPLAPIERPDRVVLHGGSPTLAAPVPLMAIEAAAAGWTEPAGKCVQRQGRFFHKEGEPSVLIYKLQGSLIGMYLYSQEEMPSPPTLVTIRSSNNPTWGSTTGACRSTSKNPSFHAGGVARLSDRRVGRTPSVRCGGSGGYRGH